MRLNKRMIYLGSCRAEAIDWVQENLGPITPRNIAEDTFKALLKEGVILVEPDEVTLTEDIDQEGLRSRARNGITTAANQRSARRPVRPGRAKASTHHASQRRHNRVTDNSIDKTGRRLDDDDGD